MTNLTTESMKQTIFNRALTMLIPASLLALCSCSQDSPWEGSYANGGLRISLLADTEVIDAAPQLRGEEVVEAPIPEQFKISLTRADGTFSKTWESLSKFSSEESFRSGTYLIEASYGSVEDEGFEKPCFRASRSFSLMADRVNEVSLTATLSNSLVSLEYTDDFKKFFRTYSAAIHSEGHSYIDIPSSEERPVYLAPGNITLQLSLEKQNGVAATFEPAEFVAEARHRYHITLDVNNGANGEGVLKITFDDSIDESHAVDIDLTDELMTAPAPKVTPIGFTSSVPVDVLAWTPVPLKFTTMALGGMAKATFTVNSSYTPPFGNEADLINADDNTRSLLASAGVKTIGFDRNPDKIGSVEVSDFVADMPAGVHEIAMVVKDPLTRVNEPVILNAVVHPLEMQIEQASMLRNSSTRATLALATNGLDLNDNMRIEILDDYGAPRECTIEAIGAAKTLRRRAADNSDAFPISRRDVTVSFPTVSRDAPVNIYYAGHKVASGTILMTADFTIEADAYARRVALRVDPSVRDRIDEVKVYCGDNELSIYSTDAATGIVMAGPLEPESDYTVQARIGGGDDTLYSNYKVISTESMTAVPNGSFSASETTININPINAGGQYKYGATTMQNKSSILVSEPVGWASLNQLTCYTGSNPMNTWFVVPSTLQNGSEVTLRSVAYDHSGTLPSLDNHGLSVRAKYSRNAPSSWSGYSAGELFLGSYSFNGTGSRHDGISFASRPTSVTFNYTYSPVNGETGEAYVALLDASGAVIGSYTFKVEGAASMQSARLPLNYSFGSKARSLQVRFRSSTAAKPAAPVPSNFQDVTNTTSLSGQTIGTNAYKSLCTGSTLKISNVVFNY